MKKINLTQFSVVVREKDGTEKEVEYKLKESIVELLFQPALKLTSVQLLKQDELARKIVAAENELLLEEEEYARLKKALDTVQGLSRSDIELVRRITEATDVEIEEIKKVE